MFPPFQEKVLHLQKYMQPPSHCSPGVSHPKDQQIYKTIIFQKHRRSHYDLVCSLETILTFPVVGLAFLELTYTPFPRQLPGLI